MTIYKYYSVIKWDEEDRYKIPAPSHAKDIQLPDGASLVLIQVDTDTYRQLKIKE